ncbi:MAG: metal ABC transporter solute-binding protein, Zn/Mn family [Planctomycetota bacterium]
MRLPAGLATLLSPLALLALPLALPSCGDGRPATTAGGDPMPARERPRVVCTTAMVGDVVRAVAGDAIDAVVLIGPGVDPHLWTPTRTEVLEILESDAVFLSGLMLEGRAGDAFARVEQSGRPVVRIAETIPSSELIADPQHTAYRDPHVWMDPVLWAQTAPAVADALARIAPASRDAFAAAATRFAADAAALDAEIARAASTVPVQRRMLVTAHDAFGYFGRRYGLEVRGIQGLSTESEPSLARIEQLVDELCTRGVPAVFPETTVGDRGVRALIEGCAARGHEVRLGDALFSDSLGRPSLPEGTWAGMLRHNARTVVEALGGRW